MAKSIKLEDLEIKEASAVDHPAHLHEGWIVMKSEELAEPAEAADEDPETNEEEAVANHDDLEPEAVVEPDTTEPALEPVLASADDGSETSVKKELEDIRKELAETKEQHIALQSQVELEKAMEAAHQWAILPDLTPSEFAPVLQSLRTKAPDEMEVVEKILNGSAIALKEAGILKELGTDSGAEAASAYDEIAVLAAARVEAGTSDSLAKAIGDVAEQRPDLYSRYVNERSGD